MFSHRSGLDHLHIEVISDGTRTVI